MRNTTKDYLTKEESERLFLILFGFILKEFVNV